MEASRWSREGRRPGTSVLRFGPCPGSCRERPRRVTTSWSIPNGPPDGPQVHELAGRLLSSRTPELNNWARISSSHAIPLPRQKKNPPFCFGMKGRRSCALFTAPPAFKPPVLLLPWRTDSGCEGWFRRKVGWPISLVHKPDIVVVLPG